MNEYMTVETTNLFGCECFSFLSADKDIENGAIIGKGDLVEGETSVYEVSDDFTNGMFLVANPAWNYENYTAESQNEENYINKKGIPFRAYELKPNRKFKVGNINIDGISEKDNVEFKDNKYAKSEQETGLKVTKIENVGFAYCIGSAGTKVSEDGYVLDMRGKKYTIETVQKSGE